jgi:hypothetical protein
MGGPPEPSGIELVGFEEPAPMAEIELFTWKQIGHFWAQLQIMSLSGRRSDMQLEKLCSADF